DVEVVGALQEAQLHRVERTGVGDQRVVPALGRLRQLQDLQISAQAINAGTDEEHVVAQKDRAEELLEMQIRGQQHAELFEGEQQRRRLRGGAQHVRAEEGFRLQGCDQIFRLCGHEGARAEGGCRQLVKAGVERTQKWHLGQNLVCRARLGY